MTWFTWLQLRVILHYNITASTYVGLFLSSSFLITVFLKIFPLFSSLILSRSPSFSHYLLSLLLPLVLLPHTLVLSHSLTFYLKLSLTCCLSSDFVSSLVPSLVLTVIHYFSLAFLLCHIHPHSLILNSGNFLLQGMKRLVILPCRLCNLRNTCYGLPGVPLISVYSIPALCRNYLGC